MKSRRLISINAFECYSWAITALTVTVYLFFSLLIDLGQRLRFVPIKGLLKLSQRTLIAINKPLKYEIPTQTMILLAEKNLKAGKNRTWVTISAISVGIGVIACLVSLGYGLESLVVSRVAKLEQLKQVDITPKPGSKLKIDDQVLAQLQQNDHVARVSPSLVLATKVIYQGATSDVPTMGTTKTFLSDTGWTLVAGGWLAEDNQKVRQETTFSQYQRLVSETASAAAQTKSGSDASTATQSAALTPAEEALLASSLTQSGSQNVSKVVLAVSAQRKVIINRALARTFGVNETAAIGQKLQLSYVLTGQMTGEAGARVESELVEYEVIGVVDDKKTPFMYVALSDMRSLGVNHYSQLKTVLKDGNQLPPFRAEIETQGYATSSVVDTVNQIKSLFATIKLFLGSIGAVALAIAALGMFNTLTVSLLERTKEIGLIKALGMVSDEVERLFLVEALLISLRGGFYGLVLGWIMGKIIGLGLSLASLPSGFQFIDVSYLPWPMVLGIVVLSFIVGVLTGIYPARRATRITALNALRYE